MSSPSSSWKTAMPNTCIWSFGSRSICSSVIYSILIEEGRQCFLQWSDLHLIFPRLQSMLGLCPESHDIGKYPTCILDPWSGIPSASNFMLLTRFPIHTPTVLV